MKTYAITRTALLRAVTVIGLFLFIPAVSISMASAQGVDCVVSVGVTQQGDTITGTSGHDTIDCTSATSGKTINGLDGNDTITGGSGNDLIDGGAGNDTITGGPGNDCLWGREGNDTLTGSAGSNTIFPGPGENTVSGNTDPEGVITGCTTSDSPAPTATTAPTAVAQPTGVATVAPTAEGSTSPTPEPGTGPSIVGVTVSSPSVTGGDSTTATVELSEPAPVDGVTVLLSSDSPLAGVADSVLVLEGDSTAVFEIGTAPVTGTTSVTISATFNDVSVSTVLEIVPGTSDGVPDGSNGVPDGSAGDADGPNANPDGSAANPDGSTGNAGGSTAGSSGQTEGLVTTLPSTGDGSSAGMTTSTMTIITAAMSLIMLTAVVGWRQRLNHQVSTR